MTLNWTQGGLADGLRSYRAGEFFAAHEHWEGVWLGSQEPEKTFLQALIQLAAAFHHYQRGNRAGTGSLLKAALDRLEGYPEEFGGIAVAPLREEIRRWMRALAERNPPPEDAFPTI